MERGRLREERKGGDEERGRLREEREFDEIERARRDRESARERVATWRKRRESSRGVRERGVVVRRESPRKIVMRVLGFRLLIK